MTRNTTTESSKGTFRVYVPCVPDESYRRWFRSLLSSLLFVCRVLNDTTSLDFVILHKPSLRFGLTFAVRRFGLHSISVVLRWINRRSTSLCTSLHSISVVPCWIIFAVRRFGLHSISVIPRWINLRSTSLCTSQHLRRESRWTHICYIEKRHDPVKSRGPFGPQRRDYVVQNTTLHIRKKKKILLVWTNEKGLHVYNDDVENYPNYPGDSRTSLWEIGSCMCGSTT